MDSPAAPIPKRPRLNLLPRTDAFTRPCYSMKTSIDTECTNFSVGILNTLWKLAKLLSSQHVHGLEQQAATRHPNSCLFITIQYTKYIQGRPFWNDYSMYYSSHPLQYQSKHETSGD